MDIIKRLSSSQNRRDEKPNTELGKEIAAKKDKKAVKELAGLLLLKDSRIQGDSIKALYEAGELAPDLLVPHLEIFIQLLQHKQNRMVWGGMSAISRIAAVAPEKVYPFLIPIMEAAENGTVITRDNTVRILTHLASAGYYKDAFPLLIEIVRYAPENQFATYAEAAFGIIKQKDREVLINTIILRLPQTETPTKIIRLKKLLKQLQKK